ncbi:hypothetical protein ACLBXO_22280 [Methylobacterium sp. C33D]
MTARPDFTPADADRALRHAQRLQRDPAAQAYGDHLRRQGLIPALVQLSAETPYDEAKAGEFEVRRSMAMRNARPCC